MAFFCIHCKSAIDPAFRACPYCGDPITDFLRRHLDDPIDGKYQILSRLAIGGMAEVYKALHIHLNSMRVIKLMRPNIAADPGAHERFLLEARLATKIADPGVATLFDFSTLDDGSQYMVWEFIEGINLQELISQRGPLPPRYAAGLAVQALQGLDAIHRAGIVHRDVSPENLMITRDDQGEERVKIIDLGIARSAVADDTKTHKGAFVGKWKYCSPEHLGMMAAGERIDARADLYSFGVVFFEMLAGVPPFRAATPHDYVILHTTQAPPALRDANPSIAAVPELERLIRKALEKDRAHRFAGAREFAQEIEALAPSLPEDAGERVGVNAADETTKETDAAAVAVGAPGSLEVEPDKTHPPRRRASQSGAGARNRWLLFLLAAAAVSFALIGVLSRSETAVPELPPRRQGAILQAPAPGHVGINAFPWGEVKQVRNLGDGTITHLAPGNWTPASLELAPGAWEITLANPAFREPLTPTVVIAAGSEQILNVHFTDPALAPFPDFGGAQ